MQTRDLFISHSSADGATAQALVFELEAGGISCWLASRDVPIGSAYQVEIVQALERCRAVLLVFSDSANASEHVLREVELAAQAKKPIYPLRLGQANPTGGLKYLLANKQWVEQKALGNRLVETIERLIRNGAAATAPKPTPVAAVPAPPPTRPKNVAIAAGAAFAGVALLAGGWFALKDGLIHPPERAGQPALGGNEASRPPVAQSSQPRGDPNPASVAPQPRIVAPAEPPQKLPPAAVPAPDVQTPAAAPAVPGAAGPAAEAARPAPEAARPASEGARAPIAPRAAEEVPPPAPKPVVLAAVPSDANAPGAGVRPFRECDVCPVMVMVPAGRSLIGSPEGEVGRNATEGPQQEIAIGASFAVGRAEVSFEEWLACVAEGGCRPDRPGDYGWGYGKQPAINVSWNDAKAYVAWLSKKTGNSYRLLSEAEWEYAARGCTSLLCPSTPFWFGRDIAPSRANYNWRYAYDGSAKAQPPGRTVPTDASEANPFGLLHMHGNVREWVEDCWNSTLSGLPKDGSARTGRDCDSRVVRGGAWSDEPKDLRSAKRSWELVGERKPQVGLRVARSSK